MMIYPMLPGNLWRLQSATLALRKGDGPTMTTIPAGSVVRISIQPAAAGMICVSFKGEVVSILKVDLEARGVKVQGETP